MAVNRWCPTFFLWISLPIPGMGKMEEYIPLIQSRTKSLSIGCCSTIFCHTFQYSKVQSYTRKIQWNYFNWHIMMSKILGKILEHQSTKKEWDHKTSKVVGVRVEGEGLDAACPGEGWPRRSMPGWGMVSTLHARARGGLWSIGI